MDKFLKVVQLAMPLLASAVGVGLKIAIWVVLMTIALVAAIFTGALKGGS